VALLLIASWNFWRKAISASTRSSPSSVPLAAEVSALPAEVAVRMSVASSAASAAGGPPGPCGAALANNSFSSLACSSVSFPSDTSWSISESIRSFMPDGPPPFCAAPPERIAVSISSSALLSALWSVASIVPAETAD